MKKIIWVGFLLLGAALIVRNWTKILDDRYDQIIFSSVVEAASLVEEVPESGDEYVDIDEEFEKKKHNLNNSKQNSKTEATAKTKTVKKVKLSEEDEGKAIINSRISAVNYEADLKSALGPEAKNSKDEFITAAEKIKRLQSQKANSPSEYEELLAKIAQLKKLEEQEKILEAKRLEQEKIANERAMKAAVAQRDRLRPIVSKQVQRDLKKTVIVKQKDYKFGGIEYEQWEDDSEIVFEQYEQEDQDGLEFASSDFDY